MENIKFYAKTAGASMLRWLMISGAGLILVLIGMFVGVMLFTNNSASGFHGAGHAGILSAILGIFTLFSEEFWTAILIVASLAFVVIYTMVASKISLGFIIYGVFENKMAGPIGEKIASTLSNKPGWTQSIKNTAGLKEKMLSMSAEDGSFNKIQRKVMDYAIKKVKLDDLNFSQDNANLPQDISNKVVQQLNEAAKPSYFLFWIAACVHIALIILAFVFDHQ